MPIGSGRYDELCTVTREKAEAAGAILIILGGKLGSGFSVQIPDRDVHAVPKLLREMAGVIEADLSRDAETLTDKTLFEA